MVTCGVRWFPICEYWIDQIDFIDKLKIKYFLHGEALKIAKEYFLKHDYTHMLVYAEDIITSPNMVKLLIKDVEEYDFPVVSGWFNWGLNRDWVAFNFKDLSKINVMWAEQYEFPSIDYVLKHDLKNPFIETFFQGMPLTLIRRDIVEKVTFKPYKVMHKILGDKMFYSGSMFDLQFAIELKQLGIKNVVDLRVFCFHFGNTVRYARTDMFGRGEVKFIPATNYSSASFSK
jgi:hypothetical protein